MDGLGRGETPSELAERLPRKAEKKLGELNLQMERTWFSEAATATVQAQWTATPMPLAPQAVDAPLAPFP